MYMYKYLAKKMAFYVSKMSENSNNKCVKFRMTPLDHLYRSLICDFT